MNPQPSAASRGIIWTLILLTAIGSFGDALAPGVVWFLWSIGATGLAAGLVALAGPSATGQDLENISV